jgi:hypothetical protein
METNIMTGKFKLALMMMVVSLVAGLVTVYASSSDNTKQRTEFFLFEAGPSFEPGPGIRFVSPRPGVEDSKAELTRRDEEIWVKAHTDRLSPGVHTNWWVIFNNPEHCEDGCDGSDLSRDGVMGSVFFATGEVIEDDGIGSFRAFLQEEEFPSDPAQVLMDFTGGIGLMQDKASTAEIHYVMRYHGPTDTNFPEVTLEDMITTFGGGCNNVPEGSGTPGNFACWDQQAAAFPAPEDGE